MPVRHFNPLEALPRPRTTAINSSPWRFLWLLFALTLLSRLALAADTRPDVALGHGTGSLLIGGNGGVYLLAEPGELIIEVRKADRNITGRPTELRAILAGPDRAIIAEANLAPGGGKPKSGLGPVQTARLSARVERRGVYALNITTSGDRYGQNVAWGFATNCPRYVIETSRGHKDERHEEPIVLLGGVDSAAICFVPGPGAVAIEATGLAPDATALSVADGTGKQIALLPAAEGKAEGTVADGGDRGKSPWRVTVPGARGTFSIDGVTRWRAGARNEDIPLWTPEAESWFDFTANRWLLTPYSHLAHGKPGEAREFTFEVHNNAPARRTILLGLEFPEAQWPARLSSDRVTLASGRATTVTLSYTVPGEGSALSCRVTATPEGSPDFSTYSTFTAKGGEALAAQPLAMPIILQPYRHENEQFGYEPDIPDDWELYYDLNNRPSVRTSRGVATLRNGAWEETDFRTAVRSDNPSFVGADFEPGRGTSKIAFDRENDMYTLGSAAGHAVLLHSTDEGRSFTAYDLGRAGGLDIEHFTGHNIPDGPPAILRSVTKERDPNLRWRVVADLDLILAGKRDGKLHVGEPVRITDECLGVGTHSGIPSAIVSRGSRIHMIWGIPTDPATNPPGTPAYVATYDRAAGKLLGEPVLIGYGAPANDGHNRPSITIDSKGTLHALTGTHGRPFQYAASLEPNTAHAGWTEPAPTGDGLRQTYIGLVCDQDDTLHLVYRLWRDGVEPFSLSGHSVLAWQRKPAGKPWEAPQPLVVPPFSEYCIYYHRLGIDRESNLFVSYDFWSTYWFYRTDHRGDRRATIFSPDQGSTWQLLSTADLE